MILIVLSVAAVASLVAVLAGYLLVTGRLLSRTAGNLDDCLQSVKMIHMHASPIGPGVVRLNKIGGDLVEALALLSGGAEQLVATKPGAAVGAPVGVGYMDAPEVRAPAPVAAGAAPVGVGYLDV